jgi:FkbM family methyltransferase
MIKKFLAKISDRDVITTIFDVGSRDCLQAIEFYNAFPKAKIYAFECNPNTLDICRNNIKNYTDRITLVEGAVCHYDGEITFYPIDQQRTKTAWKDGNPGASSLFLSNGTYTEEHYVQKDIVVNCHRLDTVMKKYNISSVDVIWMDLEGAELLALEGLGDQLTKLKYLSTEISHRAARTGQVLFDDVNLFLMNNNFKLVSKLSHQGWVEDAIYVNKLESKGVKNKFITFGAGSEDFVKAAERIIGQAESLGIFDETILYDEEYLRNDKEFWDMHGDFILQNKRGYGYMVWKSYVIKKTIENMNDGDILFFSDAGCEIDIRKKYAFFDCFDYAKSDGIVGSNMCFEYEFNKMDLVLRLDANTSYYLNTGQRQSGAILFCINSQIRKLVDEWYTVGCDHHMLNDDDSVAPNLPGFKEHRHDQSVYSLLTKKYNIYSHKCIYQCIEPLRNRTAVSKLK